MGLKSYFAVFTYKYVHAWRTVYAVFYMAGTADRMAGCSAKTDYTLYDLCCEYGIYHWNYRKQMVSPGSLGLFGYAIAVMGQICLPFALIFSFLCSCRQLRSSAQFQHLL